MTHKFTVGETYADRIIILKRTDKSITAYRMDYNGDSMSAHLYDRIGEHRYKIQIDENDNEYVIIDRFGSARFEKWGTVIHADKSKKWYRERL